LGVPSRSHFERCRRPVLIFWYNKKCSKRAENFSAPAVTGRKLWEAKYRPNIAQLDRRNFSPTTDYKGENLYLPEIMSQTIYYDLKRVKKHIPIFNPPPLEKIGGTKIGYNSAYAGDTPQMLAPTRGFSGLANLMVSVKFSSDDPCCHGNEKLGFFSENLP